MNTGFLAALISGRAVAPDAWAALDAEGLWKVADRHGVSALVADRIIKTPAAPSWLRVRAREVSQEEVVADLGAESALRQLLASCEERRIRVLLMKGALLAYTYYGRPDLRPRLDTDLLIAVEDRQAIHDVLTALGYEPDVQASTDLVSHQRAYVRPLHGSLCHVVDVHWRLTNPEVFSRVLSFDEMRRAARPIPALGPGASGLSAVHALLVACVHRVAHHFDDERLIWLYDIHLIASRLGAAEWLQFLNLVIERRVARVCHAGLQRSVKLFDTQVPDMAWPRDLDLEYGDEITAAYLTPKRRRVNAVLDDLKALGTWGDRWRLMRDYAFPPVTYMREVYAPASATPLPWLYVRRMFFGARKWLQHS